MKSMNITVLITSLFCCLSTMAMDKSFSDWDKIDKNGDSEDECTVTIFRPVEFKESTDDYFKMDGTVEKTSTSLPNLVQKKEEKGTLTPPVITVQQPDQFAIVITSAKEVQAVPVVLQETTTPKAPLILEHAQTSHSPKSPEVLTVSKLVVEQKLQELRRRSKGRNSGSTSPKVQEKHQMLTMPQQEIVQTRFKLEPVQQDVPQQASGVNLEAQLVEDGLFGIPQFFASLFGLCTGERR